MTETNSKWINPFSVDRVEDWRVEDQPENYKKIASLFAKPDFMDKLENSSITKAIFLYGGRGCGKSHILKRMAIQSEIKALEEKWNRELRITDYEKGYFGIYIKTDCFSPLSKDGINYLTDNQSVVLFEHLFNIEVVKAIIDAVKFTLLNFQDIPEDKEGVICGKMSDILGGEKFSSFDDIVKYLDGQVDKVINLTKKILFDRNIDRYISDITFTNTPDFILKVYEIIRGEISLLEKVSLVLLLDEYESLDENQQKLVNQIIKSRRLTLRIAAKIKGVKTLDTKSGEKLDEIHDYESIDLHFRIDQGREKYRGLSETIFRNRLRLKCDYGDYAETDPCKILPSPTLEDEGITEEDIEKELINMQKSLKQKKIQAMGNYWNNFKGHYKEAALFRILREKGKDKLYAGFYEYVSLSSGIVRLFIWLCREAFSLAHQNNINIMAGDPIPLKLQSDAAGMVAKNELDITIPQTINNLYASKLTYFINDIGQILRAKLYYSSEPQANRIEIINPEKFDLEEFRIPREIIESGEVLPVLLTESSFKPRDISYPFPKTFALNGIFAPLLNIPPEGRWRTSLRAEELKDLCMSELRGIALNKIVNQIRKKKRTVRKQKGKVLESNNLLPLTSKPITLGNCLITGRGCERDLREYDISPDSAVQAFLAIPFAEGWIKDPRRWIKEALTDVNVICKDTDDFPTLAYFLCKICSCVRQYPFGMFEITELNPNVVFEFGMATGLNRTNFLLVNKDKIPKETKSIFPPSPLSNIEYVPYELGRGAILIKVREKIKPTIDVCSRSHQSKCRIIGSACPHENKIAEKGKIFIGLPKGVFFKQVQEEIVNILKDMGYTAETYDPPKTLSELCQICKAVKNSSFCIIDTTDNDIAMLFALGVAFGRDKKFVNLFDTDLCSVKPISDLRAWTIEYRNLTELKTRLEEELKKRLSLE